MFRKARTDVKTEEQEENEAAYQKRVTEMESRDKTKKPQKVEDDWLGGGLNTYNVD